MLRKDIDPGHPCIAAVIRAISNGVRLNLIVVPGRGMAVFHDEVGHLGTTPILLSAGEQNAKTRR